MDMTDLKIGQEVKVGALVGDSNYTLKPIFEIDTDGEVSPEYREAYLDLPVDEMTPDMWFAVGYWLESSWRSKAQNKMVYGKFVQYHPDEDFITMNATLEYVNGRYVVVATDGFSNSGAGTMDDDTATYYARRGIYPITPLGMMRAETFSAETDFDVLNIEYEDENYDYPDAMQITVDVPNDFKDKHYSFTEDLIRAEIEKITGSPYKVVDFTAFYSNTPYTLRGNYDLETFEAREKKIGSIRIVKNPNFPSGTSLQAYIKTNRAELRKVFGNPNMGESGDGKSKGKEWNLVVGGKRVTIYDKREKDKKGTKYFNIGGDGKYGALLVAQALSIHRNERVHAKETVPQWLEDKRQYQQVKSIDEHPDLTYERAKQYEDNRRRYRAESDAETPLQKEVNKYGLSIEMNKDSLVEKKLKRLKNGTKKKAETFEAEDDLTFKEWADQEMMTHGGRESFDDWLNDELKSHGDDITLSDWGHHELDSHYERYGSEALDYEDRLKLLYEDFLANWEKENPDSDNPPSFDEWTDLVMEQNPAMFDAEGFRTMGGRGFQIEFKNGYTISIMFGDSNYGDHYNDPDFDDEDSKEYLESSQAEVAIRKPNGEIMGDILGWVSPDFVAALIPVVATGDEAKMIEVIQNREHREAESFEDFKRKMVGDGAVAGDVGYMEALEEFYEDYLEDFERITDEFCPEPETFEEFQERVLKNDYEMSLEAEDWGGNPKGKLATALRKAREKAKKPQKPLKIEKLDAETFEAEGIIKGKNFDTFYHKSRYQNVDEGVSYSFRHRDKEQKERLKEQFHAKLGRPNKRSGKFDEMFDELTNSSLIIYPNLQDAEVITILTPEIYSKIDHYDMQDWLGLVLEDKILDKRSNFVLTEISEELPYGKGDVHKQFTIRNRPRKQDNRHDYFNNHEINLNFIDPLPSAKSNEVEADITLTMENGDLWKAFPVKFTRSGNRLEAETFEGIPQSVSDLEAVEDVRCDKYELEVNFENEDMVMISGEELKAIMDDGWDLDSVRSFEDAGMSLLFTRNPNRAFEASGQWEIGEQLEEAQMNAEGSGRIDHEGGRMVAIDEVITVDYTWRTDPDDANVDEWRVHDEVEEKVESEMHIGDSSYGTFYTYDNDNNESVEVSYSWDKSIEDGGEEIIKSWAETDESLHAEGKKRKKLSGQLSDPFDELSLDSGDWKGIVIGFGVGLLGLFGYSKLRK